MATKVFFGWSGERSGKLAGIMRDWIPKVIQDVEPWLSAKDLDKGAN